MIRRSRRRRARIEARVQAATEAHLADLGKLRPKPFEQPEQVRPLVAAEQQAAWLSYWPNIARPEFVR